MSSASWTPVNNGNSTSWTPVVDGSSSVWSKNKLRSDLEATASIYDDPMITYDSVITFYDGFNPNTYSPEGEMGASWTEIAE